MVPSILRILKTSILIFFLALSMSPGLAPVVAQTTPSCPANEIFNMTVTGGVPSNFNSLLAYNSGFNVEYSSMKALAPILTAEGLPQPNSSISDVITHNSNYTSWTFHIAPNQFWSDGTPITAADVLGTYSSYFALNKTYDPVPLWPEIKNVTMVNSSAVTFNLNSADAWLTSKLPPPVDSMIYPTSFTKLEAANPGFGTQNMSGPWYIYGYTSGSSTLTMFRNPHYTPAPSICEINVNFVESDAQTPTYLTSGSSDMGLVAPADISSLLSNPSVHVSLNPGYYISFLQYNVTVYPYNLTTFRQALLYGIDENQIVTSGFNGYGVNAYSSQGEIPTISTLYNSGQMAYGFNATKASDLLKSINFTKGTDGFIQYPNAAGQPNGTDVSMTIWAGTNPTWDVTLAGLIQTDLSNIGLKVQTQSASYPTIEGYLVSNSNDLQHQLILHTSNGVSFGNALVSALNGRSTWGAPGYSFGGTWEAPASAQTNYMGNLTALEGTSAPAATTQYLNNIQAINAQYLPVIILGYPDTPVAYSTAHWTNWPASNQTLITNFAANWNVTSLINLVPVSTSSSASTTTTSSSAPGSTTTTNTGTSSSTTAPSSDNTLTYAAIAIVVIIVVAGLATYLVRRRK